MASRVRGSQVASAYDVPTCRNAPRGLAGLGRVRPVLRLGKCADARAPRRPVLATRRARRRRSGPRARLRHRPRLAAACQRRRRSRRHRPLDRMLARAGAEASAARIANRTADLRPDARSEVAVRIPNPEFRIPNPEIRARRHPASAVRRERVPDGPRAVRHPAVAAARSRSHRARSTPSRACSRPAALFGIDLVPDVPNWREYTEPRSSIAGKRRRRRRTSRSSNRSARIARGG